MKKINPKSKLIVILLTITVFLSGLATGLYFIFRTKNDLAEATKQADSYIISANLNPSSSILSVNQKIEFKNKTGSELEKIVLNIPFNAFREDAQFKPIAKANLKDAYYDGESFSEFSLNFIDTQINNQTILDTYTLAGTDENSLELNLSSPLLNNKDVIIILEYTIKLPKINHRFGITKDTVNLGHFYLTLAEFKDKKFITPTYTSFGDPFYTAVSNFDISLTLPKNYVVASSGEIISETQNSSSLTTTHKLKADAIRDFAIVVSDKFKLKTTKQDNILVSYYYTHDTSPEKSIETAALAIKTFGDLFGEYPYKTYSVCETPLVMGGMEFGSLVMINNNFQSQEDRHNVIIHETAHQWWFGIVGSDQINEAWQDEGLTEFSTALFYKHNEEYNIKYDDLMKATVNSYKTFKDVYIGILGKVDTTMTRPLTKFNTEPEYNFISYAQGCLMFENIYNILGEKQFINCLKDYYKHNAFKIATVGDLKECFKHASKTSIANLINSWISGNVIF